MMMSAISIKKQHGPAILFGACIRFSTFTATAAPFRIQIRF